MNATKAVSHDYAACYAELEASRKMRDELLEALRNFLRYSEGTSDTSSRCVEVEDAARAAIARAEGRNL